MSRGKASLTNRLTIILDSICIAISFYLAAIIRGGILTSIGGFNDKYGNALIMLILINVIISGGHKKNRHLFKRGYFEEFICIIKDHLKLAMILMAYMFMMKLGSEYSRIFFSIFYPLNFLLTYVVRSYFKIIMLIYYKKSSLNNKVMLITVSENVEDVLRRIRKEYEWSIYIDSIALWDRDAVGEEIDGVRVTANQSNILEQVRVNVVDEILIHLPGEYNSELGTLILELEKMGIAVHINLDIFHDLNLHQKTVEVFAGHQVITFATTIFDIRQVILKRFIDILGGLVGVAVTALITIFLAPAIWIESPGPIFFSQIRIGKNGRKFKIYKFRSMYPDAEERKKELMEKNEMEGLMFKMTDDPRITKIGKFIRKTSLDEFPQFLNVLKGDMSLVGTRPPTEDEFLQYEGRHKRRLTLKPGITGLWQVSGRSDILNFEEVVKLDLKYIDHFSIKTDIKLLLKTMFVVVLGRGSK